MVINVSICLGSLALHIHIKMSDPAMSLWQIKLFVKLEYEMI